MTMKKWRKPKVNNISMVEMYEWLMINARSEQCDRAYFK